MVSVIIPVRNEAALIEGTLAAVLVAAEQACFLESGGGVELIVVDNGSRDSTAERVLPFVQSHGVRLVGCQRPGSAAARNAGAREAQGRILVFVDADTHIPPQTLWRVRQLCDDHGYLAGITWLAPLERGWRARCWWFFWSQVRRLPLARAKAMPALMFCTRAAFERFGPFDERRSIGEEWPILAGVYRAEPEGFVYEQTLVARSSSRRMELQPYGYIRTFARYVWAIVHPSGRINYPDTVRHPSIDPIDAKDHAV